MQEEGYISRSMEERVKGARAPLRGWEAMKKDEINEDLLWQKLNYYNNLVQLIIYGIYLSEARDQRFTETSRRKRGNL